MRLHDVKAIIYREHIKTGAIPPPFWVAVELGIHRAGVSRFYSALLAEGALAQPYGTRGPWVLVCPNEWSEGFDTDEPIG